jgi:hypothetical protein
MRRYESVGRVGLALAAVTVLTVSARTLLAHEGHEHKALGTVAAVHEKEIRVETQDGQTLAFVLSSETTFKAGEARAQRADAKVGGRVVVVYEEEDGEKLAKEVLLPATAEEGGKHAH